MALRDLVNDTTLKSLKYGFDQLGGGDSGQPYITTDISDPNLTNLNLARGGLGSILREAGISPIITINNKIGKDDGFVRGGFLGAANAGIVDTVRIGSWIINNPLWIAKQVGLQLSNPKLEVRKGTLGAITSLLTGNIGPLTGGLLQPTRIYNLGINTLAQIPFNAFGGHFIRHGLTPIMADSDKYESIVTDNNKANKNRLVGLKSNYSFNSSKEQTLVESDIDRYITGPESAYGIGQTVIRRFVPKSTTTQEFLEIAKFTNQSNTRDWEKANISINGLLGLSKTIGTSVIPEYSSTPLSNRDQTAINYNGASPMARKYADLFKATQAVTNIVQSIPFSDSINYTSQGPSNSPFGEGRKDFKTIQNIGLNRNRKAESGDYKYYGDKKVSDDGSQASYNNTYKFDRYDSDILTVMFRGVDPFTLNEERWAFSAYLSNFRDDFNATWNDINYIGRSETFYIYSKFRRSVSFNLKIPCFNRTQLFEKHRALGQLASTTAGRYSTENNALGGVLLRLNVGNYLVEEYATMTSLQYSIPDDSPWDITPEARLAMYIEANFNFNIVHQKLPQYLPSATAEGGSKPVGFFGYLPDSVAGDKEFIRIPNRTDGEQNTITEGFAINLVDPPLDANNNSLSRGTKLSNTNPAHVIVPRSELKEQIKFKQPLESNSTIEQNINTLSETPTAAFSTTNSTNTTTTPTTRTTTTTTPTTRTTTTTTTEFFDANDNSPRKKELMEKIQAIRNKGL